MSEQREWTTEVRILTPSGDTCGFPTTEKARAYLSWLLKCASKKEHGCAFDWAKDAKIQMRQVSEWEDIDAAQAARKGAQ